MKGLGQRTIYTLVIGMIISIFLLIAIGIRIGIGISKSDSSSKTPTATTSFTSQSNKTPENIIFDAKKLVGAKKQDVDKLLNITGTQDTSEPYVYHYGNDKDVVFDDNGICLDLCLDTDENGYKSADETEIFKSYGIDLVDSYYKQSTEYVKSYTKVKDFGEIDIFYNSNTDGSSTDIKQIVFYTESSKKFSDFLEEKSKEFENELNNKNNTKNTNSNSNNTIRQKRLQANWNEYPDKSALYNDYAYELEGLEGSTESLIGMDKTNVNSCYDKYNNYINRLWNDLKSQCSKSEFENLAKDEDKWVNKKMSQYPTCDSKNGTFNDKDGAIKMTDERIGELLNYLN